MAMLHHMEINENGTKENTLYDENSQRQRKTVD